MNINLKKNKVAFTIAVHYFCKVHACVCADNMQTYIFHKLRHCSTSYNIIHIMPLGWEGRRSSANFYYFATQHKFIIFYTILQVFQFEISKFVLEGLNFSI